MIKRSEYERQIHNGYVRSMEELSTYMNNITVSLYKGIYAGTPYQLSGLSSKLWRDAGSAKAALSQLPLSQKETNNTVKFLSQVGDYAMSVSRKAALDNSVSEEDYDKLKQLYQYAKSVTEQLTDITQAVARGNYDISSVFSSGGETPYVASGFQDIEEGFADYPTLIYDGPFSDNVLEREPLTLKELGTVSRDEARIIAASLLGCESALLENGNDIGGTMPSYCFSLGDKTTVSVTKAGGIGYFIETSHEVTRTELSVEQAVEKASLFLKKHGFEGMTENYYETENGICTVNFAYTHDEVVCYTDLIKVSIALDDGHVVWFDARGYLYNHRERDYAKPEHSFEQAEMLISPYLTVTNRRRCIIPSLDLSEKSCYEFKCTGFDDEPVLVYINTENLIEEQILILEISNDSVLAQ